MIIEARQDTITLRGSIKKNIWPAIQAAAALLLRDHPTGIIIDCSGITEFNRKGAETFQDAFRYITAHNARILVAELAPELLEIGRAVPGVRSQLPMAASVAEARASLELEEIIPERGKARLAAMVPMLGNWRRAVVHTDRLASAENCEVHLVDSIKVPHTLPIGSPLPERESEGQQRLEAAKETVEQTGLKSFTHVERVRSHAAGLVRFADEINIDFAVVSIDSGPHKTDPYIGEQEALSMLEEADFEISLIKGSPEDHSAASRRCIVPVVGEWEHALEHACRLAKGDGAEIVVLSVISVPRSDRIDAPKPEAEESAANNGTEALRIGKRMGAKVTPVVERVRDPILGLLKFVENGGFDLAVVGVRHETEDSYSSGRSAALALMQELYCETVFLRIADRSPI